MRGLQRTQGNVQRGFTLLELLVILILVGVIASLATLSIGDGGERELRAETDRLVGALRLARDELLITGQADRALGLRRDSYSFLELVILDDQTREWRPLNDRQLGFRQLEEGLIELDLELATERRSLRQTSNWEPHIRLSSTGEMTPAVIVLRIPRTGMERRIEVGLEGKVEVLHALARE